MRVKTYQKAQEIYEKVPVFKENDQKTTLF
jgi:hypothetical protein